MATMDENVKKEKVKRAFKRRDVYRIDFSVDGLCVEFFYKRQCGVRDNCILSINEALEVLAGERMITNIL